MDPSITCMDEPGRVTIAGTVADYQYVNDRFIVLLSDAEVLDYHRLTVEEFRQASERGETYF